MNKTTRKLLYLLLAITIISCGGDDDGNAPLDYLGTYRGDVMTYVNGSYIQTLNNHSMSFISIGSSNEVMIDGNLIITNTCQFDSSGFVIPSTQAVSTQTSYVLEYGSGTLNGDELQIELHQDNYDATTNLLVVSGYWTGTLTKVE
ncbi:MAG: hypothetical protein CMC65_10870 [Flavobacteriaceae bacterium]|nr:hypothetical protein [Flavobacteriaceae bacterium]